MSKLRKSEIHHRKQITSKNMPNMARLKEKLGDAWMARIEKEIKIREPNITEDQLQVRRHELLKLMAEEIKKNKG